MGSRGPHRGAGLRSSSGWLLLISVLLLWGRAAPPAAADGATQRKALAEVRRQVRLLAGRWAAARGKLESLMRRVEAVREASRRAERAASGASSVAPPWKKRWRAMQPARAVIHARLASLLAGAAKALADLLAAGRGDALDESERREVADAVLGRLDAWVSVGEPQAILESIRDTHPALGQVLAWHANAGGRRAFLARVVARLAWTPEQSDVDVLRHVVEWDALFLRARRRGRRQLDALSTDLILLFTDRAADGVSPSRAGLHRRGRFRDRGFKPELRDGSDQVRHFAWALRMFATSRDRGFTEGLLGLKERRDAELRGQPVDRADLELNRVARRLVELVLGTPPSPRPLGVERYAGLIGAALAG